MSVTVRNRNNALLWECDGQPTAADFTPGGVAGLTLPMMMIDRTSRTLYFLNASGDVVQLAPVAV